MIMRNIGSWGVLVVPLSSTILGRYQLLGKCRLTPAETLLVSCIADSHYNVPYETNTPPQMEVDLL